MATKVKETPILIGKDAIRFEKIIKENETKCISKEEYEKALTAFKKFKVIN